MLGAKSTEHLVLALLCRRLPTNLTLGLVVTSTFLLFCAMPFRCVILYCGFWHLTSCERRGDCVCPLFCVSICHRHCFVAKFLVCSANASRDVWMWVLEREQRRLLIFKRPLIANDHIMLTSLCPEMLGTFLQLCLKNSFLKCSSFFLGILV